MAIFSSKNYNSADVFSVIEAENTNTLNYKSTSYKPITLHVFNGYTFNYNLEVLKINTHIMAFEVNKLFYMQNGVAKPIFIFKTYSSKKTFERKVINREILLNQMTDIIVEVKDNISGGHAYARAYGDIFENTASNNNMVYKTFDGTLKRFMNIEFGYNDCLNKFENDSIPDYIDFGWVLLHEICAHIVGNILEKLFNITEEAGPYADNTFSYLRDHRGEIGKAVENAGDSIWPFAFGGDDKHNVNRVAGIHGIDKKSPLPCQKLLPKTIDALKAITNFLGHDLFRNGHLKYDFTKYMYFKNPNLTNNIYDRIYSKSLNACFENFNEELNAL